MVDNKQLLKSKVESDLRKKIVEAQKILSQLQESVRGVEKNASKAKEDVNLEISSIHQLVRKRKVELNREIDIISNKQITSLRDSINELCVAIGSLEGTLTNLDSFNVHQLLSLNIPEIDGRSPKSVSPVRVDLDSATLNKEVMKWGTVTCRGVSGFFDVGNSASLPERFVEYHDKHSMDHKPLLYAEGDAFIDVRPPPKLPSRGGASSAKGSLCSEFDLVDLDNLEELLTSVKLQTLKDEEDGIEFEVITVENVDEPKRDQQPSNEKENRLIPETFNGTDLSEWVKPRKRSYSDEIAGFLVERKHSGDNNNPQYLHNPLNNQFVEFPCLRTDAKAWVSPKRFKCSDENDLELPFPATGIVPSVYYLPASCWLKRSS
jgi:hypothetical protein